MRLFTIFLLLISFTVKSQTCSQPGMVPATAISVCGTTVFNQPNVSSCQGQPFPYSNCAATPAADNAFWYTFHCYQSGTLGFLLTPLGSDDYDWVIVDVTGHSFSDIFTDASMLVSLNLSAALTTTGCTPAGTTNVNCEGSTPAYNSMPNLIAGHDYMLCVSNWSNSGLGYNLSFTGGTSSLTDNTPPVLTNVHVVGCNASLLSVKFSKDILCSSLTAAASEFTITNGTHVISSISTACSVGSNAFDSMSISLQNPLPAGNYQLVINNGSDGNTLLGVCNDPTPGGNSFPFTVPVQNPLAVNNISFSGCAATVLKVALSKPIHCNTATATGSEFSITPGNPAISSVVTNCNALGLTDTIRIVMQGHLANGNYQLTINNGTDGNTLTDTCGISFVTGYQFPVVINQNMAPPVIQTVSFDECLPNQVVLNFDKPVLCNSISGDEFTITPGTFTVTNVSNNCNPAGNTNIVTLQFSGNLPAGNFTIHVNNGTDVNTISDTCFAYMPVNYTKPFTTTQAPLPTYDSVQFNPCNPDEIKVFYSQPIQCGTYACDGSEFLITGPSPVNIDYVSAAIDHCCLAESGTFVVGNTNWIMIHLSQPIMAGGTYVLHNLWGGDGNSVATPCHAGQDTLETISFNVLETPSAVFNEQIHWGCVMDTFVLSHPGGSATSWTWNFSDGTSASGQSTTHLFPSTTDTATVELIVSNGLCNDTLKRKYPLDNAINAGVVINPDTVCINSPVEVLNTSTGNNLQWFWQFGDNTTDATQYPLHHSYAANGQYNISLIITNDHGCKDTATRNVTITSPPIVDFTGLNLDYCTGDSIRLATNIQGNNISSYAWNTTNNIHHLVENQPVISFTYYTAGYHTISLIAEDRFCGTSAKDSTTLMKRTPLFSLGNDTTLCPGLTIPLGSFAIPGYVYLWNTGATTSSIITDLQSSNYHLTVNNNGCIADDSIFVTVLDNCLIKVPAAFTPDRNGLNDYLKAINADLATNFTFRVYNRFGQLIFSTHNPLHGWDGTFKGNPVDAGTYVWQLSYIHPVSKKQVFEKGTSILIRQSK
ncbi:MAG: PKD domain-containing protein [Ferruginibacter sp.]